MDAETKTEVTRALNEIILDRMPDAAMLNKYGGVIVEMVAGQPTSQCCGYFVYKNHVSLEFTDGIKLRDVDGILEGSGKHRRHIKLTNLSDIETKRCSEFLDQVSKFRRTAI